MKGVLEAYKAQVDRVTEKVRRGEELSEGERYFVLWTLESAGKQLETTWFTLAQFAEPKSEET